MAYTLYYSKSCRYCNEFCTLLAPHQGLCQQFRFIDAARVPNKGMSVPMLVVNNQAIVGRDAFTWLRQMTMVADGPQCYDVCDSGGGLEFTDIDGTTPGVGSRSKSYCGIDETGASAMATMANSTQAQMMDPRVAQLIRARSAQVPGPVMRY